MLAFCAAVIAHEASTTMTAVSVIDAIVNRSFRRRKQNWRSSRIVCCSYLLAIRTITLLTHGGTAIPIRLAAQHAQVPSPSHLFDRRHIFLVIIVRPSTERGLTKEMKCDARRCERSWRSPGSSGGDRRPSASESIVSEDSSSTQHHHPFEARENSNSTPEEISQHRRSCDWVSRSTSPRMRREALCEGQNPSSMMQGRRPHIRPCEGHPHQASIEVICQLR